MNKSAVFKQQSVPEFSCYAVEISRVDRAPRELSRGIWHAPIRSFKKEKLAPKVGALEKLSPPAVAKTATVKVESVLGFSLFALEILRVGGKSSKLSKKLWHA